MSTNPVGALPPGQDRAALIAEVRRVLDAAVPGAGGSRAVGPDVVGPDAGIPRAAAVLAVSGGPDSVALAYLVAEARPDLVACIAHVRHGLRDDAADASVAAAHAQALGLGYHEQAVDVRPAGQGPEAAARDARYTALSRVASTVGAGAIIVGHTADDQAETVLLNVARGTGLAGLAGMAADRPHAVGPSAGAVRVVRPLLRLRREDVHAFVAREGLRVVRDPTNRDPRQRRARARHDLLPRLAALSGGPGDPVGALTRLADLARDDADALDTLAASSARRLVVDWGPARAVETERLRRLPDALARRVARLFLAGVGRTEVSSAAVAEVLALQPGQAVHVPGGMWVTSGGGWIAAVPPGTEPLPERPLSVPGSVELPELGMVVRAGGEARGRLVPAADAGPEGAGHGQASGGPAPGPPGSSWPPAALLRIPAGAGLVVRGRRSGDRLADTRLTDALSAAGVPRALRDLVPLVADASGRVLWVAGLAPPHAHGTDRAAHRDTAVVRVWLLPAPAGG